MAFVNMHSELRGDVPKLPLPLSQTLVNRALQKIYDENVWSFQLSQSGWLTPSLISAGTITATIGSTSIVGDAAASAAWLAISASALKTMQIRLPAYALYSVVNFVNNAGIVTLTIDRPWMEPAGSSLQYMMYQAYYPAPVADFKRWLTVRDFTNAIPLDYWSWKQADLQYTDPQRTVFQNADHVVPFTIDTRTGSATLNYMLFELYPHQLAQLPYALYFVRNGSLLSNPGDTVPAPLTEDLVIARAKVLAYEWAESQKGRYVELQKTNWQFLMKAADAQYKERIKDIRKKDRDLVDNFVTILRRANPSIGAPFYSAVTGQANVGNFGG